MGFWEIIEAWLNQANDRKVVIHKHNGKTSVDLFWRGQCVRKYTKEEISSSIDKKNWSKIITPKSKTKTKPKRKKD